MSPVPTETRITPIGIVLALYPSDPGAAIEVNRAPDSGGSPDTGNAETIAVVPPGTETYTDYVAGGTWHYRIRSLRAGATASSWTGWVAATPVPLPATLPPIPDVGGWIIKQGSLESTDGNIVLDAPNEAIRMGSATAILTGTGFFAGSDGSGGMDFRVGNPSGRHIVFDESAGTFVLDVESFTAANPVFDGDVTVEAGEGGDRIILESDGGGGGRIRIRDSATGSGTITMAANLAISSSGTVEVTTTGSGATNLNTDVNVLGALNVGGTSDITGIITHHATGLNFGSSVAANSASSQVTVTVTGAAAGDIVTASLNLNSTGLGTTERISVHARVSAANTVALWCYNGKGTSEDMSDYDVDIIVFQDS